jgi:hypothetical protein
VGSVRSDVQTQASGSGAAAIECRRTACGHHRRASPLSKSKDARPVEKLANARAGVRNPELSVRGRSRRRDNSFWSLGAVDVELSADDLRDIEEAAAKIPVPGGAAASSRCAKRHAPCELKPWQTYAHGCCRNSPLTVVFCLGGSCRSAGR